MDFSGLDNASAGWLSALRGCFSGLDSRASSLEAAVADLQARVAALEDPPAPAPTYASSTSWSRGGLLGGWAAVPATTRTVNVTDKTGLVNALNGLQAGDHVVCQGAVTVAGEITLQAQLAAPAVIDAGSWLFTGVAAGTNLPALWVNGAKNVHWYGGDFTSGGNGIRVDNGQFVRVWDATIHDCGNTGLAVFPITRDAIVDVRAVLRNNGVNLVFDPHTEKGTGQHGVYLGGGTSAPYAVRGRLAADVSYQKYGFAIEANHVAGLEIYVRADHLGYGPDGSIFDSTSGSNGSVLACWGDNPSGDVFSFHARYVEAHSCRGRALECLSLSASGASSTVDYGRADGMCLNSQIVNDGLPLGTVWDTRKGVQLLDVQPVP